MTVKLAIARNASAIAQAKNSCDATIQKPLVASKIALAIRLALLAGTVLAAAAQAQSVIALSSLDGSNGFRLDGVAENDAVSRSVAGAGDINGDGIHDLVLGAYLADPNGEGSGASYVVFGRSSSVGFAANIDLSSLNGSNGFRLDGVATRDYSGISVAAAGDINTDGVSDLIVGATSADPNGAYSGSSYIVFGRSGATPFASSFQLSSLNGSNGFRLDGASGGDQSGRKVAGLGDVNGDGIDDVIVSADRADANGTDSGSSYVLFGRASSIGFASSINLSGINGSNGFRLVGATAGDMSGMQVSAAGDINGDGINDLIVATQYAQPSGVKSGSSYVVFGRGTATPVASSINLGALDGINGFRLDGVAANDYSGFSAGAAGDINADGVDDLVVGAYGADPIGSASGSGYVVFGRTGAAAFGSSLSLSSLNGNNGFRLDGAAAGNRSGFAAAAAGDFNGDSISDLIIGAYGAQPNGFISGSSYVLFGRSGASAFASTINLSTLSGGIGLRFDGAAEGDRSGVAVAAAGDVNADGVDDLMIAASDADPNAFTSGSVYVVFGNTSFGVSVFRNGFESP